MLVLFTDTDTDLTPAAAKEFGYHLISMPYSIDGETVYPYEDFETFDAHAFYDRLRAVAKKQFVAAQPRAAPRARGGYYH